ncbi:type 1 glutamine amidotransferase domain-containing protein [Alicyclobacillus mali]|uniref:Type 1 glutamine amidotransferase domain-containing protein n=1 Tax=Alicyclobacillus mali (ex Roth et al. 2021) TaxID=1123961 RepID=A0ABS0F087_9BACL|nr:type 1 glutamine amidotransferase domain-containing protein [Alicyclobacillus mali (ex Roth et al. 2021)]MBF8376704.1 type 1 glutamine amidotransferase domain-containing protein [Alicyclobacillus mali (ex Roth et al. 2021)]MCL6488889.1 type 1 glutamine amidotransferase domain-containing protein [Alicyclobacillus mali (ex Roth et al. 2021)]
MAKKVLMVVTSADKMTDGHPTGLWLSEFAEPYTEFKQAGYEVTVASPRGGQAPIDDRSVQNGELSQWAEAVEILKQTVPLSRVSASDFDAIFLPGGHGTMFDFPDSAELQALIRTFAESGKVVAAVCHGPAGLVNVRLSNGDPLVKGKRVTAFTDEEERAVELDDKVPFMLETRLREMGAQFVAQPMWSDHVEQDGHLITGQNPQSGISAAKAVIKALEGAH